MKYDPEKNGIETPWHSTKMKFRSRLTEEKIKETVDFDTKQIVIEVLENTPQETIRNCATHGLKQVFSDKRSIV